MNHQRTPIRFLLEEDLSIPERPKRPKHRNPSLLAAGMKGRYNSCECEACGWTPSASLKERFPNWDSIIHAHHVVPRSCGGKDIRENIVILCPICHAIAHKIGRIILIKDADNEWRGPHNAAIALAEIRELRSDEKSTTAATTLTREVETT